MRQRFTGVHTHRCVNYNDEAQRRIDAYDALIREADRIHDALDPGVTIDKIIIDMGGVKDSYLGPPDSYSNQPPQ